MLRRAQPARLFASNQNASSTRLLLLDKRERAIGSAEANTLRIDHASVGERHAIIRYVRGHHYVIDLKSASGTFVNGQRVRRKQQLKHGDNLRFGTAIPYRFIDPDARLRRSHRREMLVASITMFVAAVLLVRFENWDRGLLSAATFSEIIARAETSRGSNANHATSSAAGELTVPSANAKAAGNEKQHEHGSHRVTPAIAAAERPASSPAEIPIAANKNPTANQSAPTWLERINHYRTMARLGALHEDSQLSAAVSAHASYLLLNYSQEIRSGNSLGDAGHSEDSAKRGYSKDGAQAAQNSQLGWGCGAYNADAQIDQWIAGPFHRLAMLNPFVEKAGFGEAAAKGCWVTGLRLPPPQEEVKPYDVAVQFPPEGASISLDWTGNEAPDPLTSCDDYEMPAGLPITIQLGRLVEAELSAHSLTADGVAIEHCAFDAHSYRNPNASMQEYGRWALSSSGAIMIIPRAPLRSGARYSVSITAGDKTYAWSFRVVQ